MDMFVMQGPTRLNGTVVINGAKNAVLPLMAAALLSRGKNVIENVPRLRDVQTMIQLLEILGARVTFDKDVLTIDTTRLKRLEAPYELVRTMRASIYVLGPLVAAHRRARVSMPGGCAWGPRPIDLHLMALERLGAKLTLDRGYINASANRLKGAEIVFPISSVGATGQTLMACVLAKGVTTIKNAALEPEMTELAKALVSCGAKIEGIGQTTMTIEGVDEMEPLRYRVMPDRIEAGTFAAAAAATGGKVRIDKCNPSHLESVIAVLQSTGAKIQTGQDEIFVEGPERVDPIHVVTREYPGFPTDMQAQIIAVLCRARGTSTVKDTIYPDRFTHIPELRRLGANIRLDGNIAVITGVKALEGAPVMATDIRASSALIIAGLMARGRTEIRRVYHIDRGYEAIEKRLRKLGANIRRVAE
ncbi:MAG: UDP-N-acetylglucosamine 1-carboxyvinyltransferase [Candidatus Krumholzibacteriota bacterium]|nr:UDP-N-acetylglucosamine 1-carboxyvinyltransferase [Candidatus Krumholzibacteriota bacterium]